jgi:hypothetical protein
MRHRRRRALVEVLSTLKEQDSKPSVTISKLSDGSITYSVKATGRDVVQAAKKAKATFSDLTVYAEAIKTADLSAAMAKMLAEMGHR